MSFVVGEVLHLWAIEWVGGKDVLRYPNTHKHISHPFLNSVISAISSFDPSYLQCCNVIAALKKRLKKHQIIIPQWELEGDVRNIRFKRCYLKDESMKEGL